MIAREMQGVWRQVLMPLMLAGSAAAAQPLFETSPLFPAAPDDKPNYRIPAILEAPNGDILVFAEKRNDGPGDIGDHDIVLKRSGDLGRTWDAEQVILDDGKQTCADITVGRVGDKLWLFFLRDKKHYACFTSTDSGATWDGPVSIHAQVTRPGWDELLGRADEEVVNPKGRMAMWEKNWFQRYGVGPGNTVIQLRSGPRAGRIIVPARHREEVGDGRLRSFAHCFFSDDYGSTWTLGGNVGLNTSECQLVELANGDVMVVSRNESADDAPDNLRHLVAISRDGAETWGPLRRAEELITPRCHGSVERFTLASTRDRNRLLFSSPASPFRQKEHPYGRYNLTVRLSYDEGATWTAGKSVWPHPSSYSDMVVLDDRTIAYVYERGAKGTTHYWDALHFARFNLEWLTDGRDSLEQAFPERSVLWKAGEEGYHTYRIPALLVTAKGSVLAFCEGRKTGAGDHGDLDLLMKRSIDGGLTWSPQKIVHEEGGDARITIGNPCPVVDTRTGTIWLPFTRDNKAVFITSSTDDGRTWSAPRDISAAAMRTDWVWVATGPGVGIQLTGGPHKGRLIIPSDHKRNLAGDALEMNSHMMFSDDGGQSWQIGDPIQPGGNECQIIERADGSLLVNTRMQGDFQGFRGVATSRDGGETWSPIAQERQLPCPKCQASLLRLESGEVLFSNPHPRGKAHGEPGGARERLTVRMSADDGRTWHASRVLHDGPAAYSGLALLPDGTILCLYEGGERKAYESLRLARFNLGWLGNP